MNTDKKQRTRPTGADIVVKTLEQHDVKWVFGILVQKSTKSSIRSLTPLFKLLFAGTSTSGPGVSNLVTGLSTANTEGDPVIALGGAVLWLTWWQRNKA
jgi:acetolactate synthase-1/2/3 large subunit